MSAPLVWYVGDRNPSITEQITSAGAAVDLSGSTVRFKMRPLRGETLKVDQPAVIVAPASQGNVRYDWQAGDVDTAGFFLAWWEVTTAGKVQAVLETVIEFREHGVEAQPAYVELEQLKQTLTLAGTSFADWDLQVAAQSASRLADEITGRRFYPDADANQVRTYTALSDVVVHVDDLLQLTSLKTDPDGDGTFDETWAAADYRLEPLNAAAEGRPWERIRRHPAGDYCFPTCYPAAVQVTGKFGWSAAPAQIVEATMLLATRLLKRKREAPFGLVAVAGVESGTPAHISRVDPDVRALLDPFVRDTLKLQAF